MTAVVAMCTLLMKHKTLSDEEMCELVTIASAALLKQSLERISRVRQVATGALADLLQAKGRARTATCCQHRELLLCSPNLPTGKEDVPIIQTSANAGFLHHKRSAWPNGVADCGLLALNLLHLAQLYLLCVCNWSLPHRAWPGLLAHLWQLVCGGPAARCTRLDQICFFARRLRGLTGLQASCFNIHIVRAQWQ